jgi:predicted metal-binding membrane protein
MPTFYDENRSKERTMKLRINKSGERSFFTEIAILWPWALVLIAWCLLLFASSTHQLLWIDHTYLLSTSHLPWLVACLAFLASWQLMTIAMMLPSTFSMFSRITVASLTRGSLWIAQLAFLFAYAAVWTIFAFVAFVSDTLFHQVVKQWFWLYYHSWLVGVTLLVIAGCFQFSPLKRWCLQRCGNPSTLCEKDHRHTIQSAGYLGWRYGWFCLGSCWALMFIMFALGGKSLLSMSLLAVAVLVEKEIPCGKHLRPMIGVALLLLAALWWSFSGL